MNSFVGRCLCLFGRHSWRFRVWTTRGGIAIGDKCERCGLWSSSALRQAYNKDQE